MGAPVPVRDDIPAGRLRRLARKEANGRVACRLLALANVLDGLSREDAARRAGMDRQTLRDWVIRFNAEGSRVCAIAQGAAARPGSTTASWRRSRPWCCAAPAAGSQGRPPVVAPERRAERDGVSSWRARDLCRIVEDRCGVSYTENGMLRLLHDLGLS